MCKDKKCAFILVSCDKNKDLIDGFFVFFNRFWHDCKYDKYLLVEERDIKVDGVVTIKHAFDFWSKRVMEEIKTINAEYLIVALDDFWIEDYVDSSIIDEAIHYMECNPLIVNLSFSYMVSATNKQLIYPFVERHFKTKSLVNWQFGIWKKEALLRLMREKENPWQSELLGTERAKRFKKNVFGCVSSPLNSPVKYNNGWLVVRGSWNKDEVLRLEQKTGIKIHLGDRKSCSFGNKIPQKKSVLIKMKLSCFFERIKSLFISTKEPL